MLFFCFLLHRLAVRISYDLLLNFLVGQLSQSDPGQEWKVRAPRARNVIMSYYDVKHSVCFFPRKE